MQAVTSPGTKVRGSTAPPISLSTYSFHSSIAFGSFSLSHSHATNKFN